MKPIPSFKKLKLVCLKRGVYVDLDTIISRIAIYPTKLFLYTPLRPMHVMLIWFILQLVACFIIIYGGSYTIVGGILLFQLAIILDHSDGQMARFLDEESVLALYVDQLYHNIANPLFILALSYRADMVLIGIMIVAVYFLNRVIIFNHNVYNLKNERVERIIQETIGKDQKKLAYSRMKAHEKTIFSRAYEWFRIEHPLSVMFWGALLGLLRWTLYLYLLLFIIDFFRRLFFQLKSLRDTDRLLQTK